MLVAREISSPSTATPAPVQNSHQIGPPCTPATSPTPPSTKPSTMMPTATHETVRPWYEGCGPSCAGDKPSAATAPWPAGPPGITDVSCMAASLCDVPNPNSAPPGPPESELSDMVLLLPGRTDDVPDVVASARAGH